jgi:hypothetical protein
VLTGFVKEESPEQITLVAADGKSQEIRVSEIDERALGHTSLMPEGLARDLAPQEFADLIAYLENLRTSGQGTPGSAVTGPVSLPPGFTRTCVGAAITGATAMEVAPDGRVFICEQTGALRIVKGDQLLDQPFVTLEVDSTWERGLIGVAIDPEFAKSQHIYVTYVAPKPYAHHCVSRFTACGDKAEPGSEIILLEGDDQTKLGGSVSVPTAGSTWLLVSRPRGLPRSAWTPFRESCSASILTVLFQRITPSTSEPRASTARSGRLACATHSLLQCSPAPGESSSTT